MALFLFHSSACSHHKTEPDKAHRQSLDDLRAAPKAERAPERSLILTSVHERKRLRDSSSSERSEGRLAHSPVCLGRAWVSHCFPPPFKLLEKGACCFRGVERGHGIRCCRLSSCVLELLLPPEKEVLSTEVPLSRAVCGSFRIGHSTAGWLSALWWS